MRRVVELRFLGVLIVEKRAGCLAVVESRSGGDKKEEEEGRKSSVVVLLRYLRT